MTKPVHKIENNPAIVYIAGTGRSGSTLLDRVISASEQVLGCGELSQFFDVYMESQSMFCSCGYRIRECTIWGKIFEKLEKEYHLKSDAKKLQRVCYEIERKKGFLPAIFLDQRDIKNYRIYTRALLQSFEDVGSGCTHIVDSSTSSRMAFFRPLALLRFAGRKDMKMIHLTRDPRGIIYGFLRRPANRKTGEWLNVGPCGVYTLFKWLIVNIWAFLQGLFLPRGQYLYITYEELIDSPEVVFAKLERFLDVSPIRYQKTNADIELIGTSHQLTGNAGVLRQNPLLIKGDQEWQEKLPRRYKFCALIFIALWKICFEWVARWRSAA